MVTTPWNKKWLLAAEAGEKTEEARLTSSAFAKVKKGDYFVACGSGLHIIFVVTAALGKFETFGKAWVKHPGLFPKSIGTPKDADDAQRLWKEAFFQKRSLDSVEVFVARIRVVRRLLSADSNSF